MRLLHPPCKAVLGLAVEHIENALCHRQHLPAKVEVAAVSAVFLQRDDEGQAEGGNGDGCTRRRAQLQQAVLALGECQQAKVFAGEVEFAEGVVAGQHLAAGVEGVQRLLAPRAVLIVLVHTAQQRPTADLGDAIVQRVVQMQLWALVHGIARREHAGFVDRDRPAVDDQLQIPAAQPPEPVDELRPRGPCGAGYGKAPAAYAGAHAEILKVLAEAHIHDGVLGTDHVQRQIAFIKVAEIQQQEYAVTRGRFKMQSAFGGQRGRGLAGHSAEILPKQSGKLHPLADVSAAGLLKRTLCDDYRGQTGIHAELTDGARHALSGLVHAYGGPEGSFLRDAPREAEAELRRDGRNGTVHIGGDGADGRVCSAGAENLPVAEQLKPQARRLAAIAEGILAGIPALNAQPVSAGTHQRGHFGTLHRFGGGKVGILGGGHAHAVDEGDKLTLNADVQAVSTAFRRVEIDGGLHITVGQPLAVQPDPLGCGMEQFGHGEHSF